MFDQNFVVTDHRILFVSLYVVLKIIILEHKFQISLFEEWKGVLVNRNTLLQ